MKYFTEKNMLIVSLFIICTGIPFLIWFYSIDGIYLNKPMIYTQGVNPLELKLTKKEYKRGEMVQFYTSYCKPRESKAQIQWSLINEMVIFYSPGEWTELPIGCYPAKQNYLLVQDLKEVPQRASLGKHKFTGIITRELPGGRIIKQEIGTEEFQVIN